MSAADMSDDTDTATPAADLDALNGQIRLGLLALGFLAGGNEAGEIMRAGGLEAERLGYAVGWVGERLLEQTEAALDLSERLMTEESQRAVAAKRKAERAEAMRIARAETGGDGA